MRTSTNRGRVAVIGAALVGLLLTTLAVGQSDISAGDAPAAPIPVGEKSDKKPERFREYKDVIADMEAMQGFLTLYRYNPRDENRDTETLLCRIPRNLLDEDILFATSLTGGGPLTGYTWQTELIRFREVGDYIKIVTPDVRYKRNPRSAVNDAVERTYSDSYIATAKILTKTRGGDPVIDLGKLLKSDIAGVSFLGGNPRPELSTWNKVKVFQDNVLIDTNLALGGRSGGRMVGVGYGFRRLPKLGSYTPRVADQRVGYFLTARRDWSAAPDERTTFDRYINRWKLEKQDPSLELSPPKEPIVFVIEKTVPIRWRRYVRDGILEWNKAFEKIGFSNAIIVHQQTDNNEFANYDPEDARHNFFRWIVSGRAFAMGPSRVDPRTGEILDADIIMDDSFVRAFMEDFNMFGPEASVPPTLGADGFQQWFDHQPELAEKIFAGRKPQIPDDSPEAWFAKAREQMQENWHSAAHCGDPNCTFAHGFRTQLAFAANAYFARTNGKQLPERLLGEAIKDVVTHEVGHTLGLRHNFKASNWLSLEEIMERRNTDLPTTASVMDYNPLLLFKGDNLENVKNFVTPTIGPYDEWAIEYGYAVPGKGQNEQSLLKEITAKCTQPGLDYLTDEDTSGSFTPDPFSNRYDMGDCPIKWATARAEMADELLPTLLEWSVRDGEARYHARSAFQSLWFEKVRNFGYVSQVVGGQQFFRDHKGDPNARPVFELLDPQMQREALQVLDETLFDDTFFAVDPELLNNLAPNRWSHWGSFSRGRLDFPIHDTIRNAQFGALVTLSSPAMLMRVYDSEIKTDDENKMTAAEIIRTVRDMVWDRLDERMSGKYSDAKPYLSSIQRNLQREHLRLAMIYAQLSPGQAMPADLVAMWRQSLRDLSGKIGTVLDQAGDGEDSKLDFASRAHLVECKSSIDRMLHAQYMAN